MFSEKVSLHELCEINMGQAPPGTSYNDKREGYPLIAGAGDFGVFTPSVHKYTIFPTKIAKKGDIVLCIRATIGDLNWADKEYCLGRGVAGLRTKKDLDSSYLWWWLTITKDQLVKLGKGSTYKQISRADIESHLIPLLPLSEQKRIAAILDKADAIRRKRRKAIQLADEFLRAVFLEMFGDPAFNTKKWRRKQIVDLGKVTLGNTPSRKQPEYYGDFIEWIKSDNINTPYHFITQAEEWLSEKGMKAGRIIPPNSILVTCIAGSPDCIGNAAITDRKVALNQQINAITPFDDVDLYFLYFQILVGKKIIQSASTNSMKGMVSKEKFQEISLINPPLSLQKKFADVFKKCLQHEKKHIELNENSATLFSSLTQLGFQGYL